MHRGGGKPRPRPPSMGTKATRASWGDFGFPKVRALVVLVTLSDHTHCATEDFTAAPRFPSAYEPIGGVGMPQLRGNSGDDSWWHGPSMDEVFTHLEGLSDSSMASLVDDGGDESVAFGRLYPGADLDTADGSLLYHDSVCGW